MDAKKKSLIASERDDAARAAWWQEIQELEWERLVFVDESGCHLGFTPLYGWAPRSERAVGSAPRNKGKNVTMLGALSPRGVQAALTLEGSIDTGVFEFFVEEVLVPTLEPGQIVVLDNLSSHKSDKTRELIQACGCELLFLPSYSPDFSPIEPAWSKLKAYLRRAKARTRDALDEALTAGLQLISRQDAQAWFNHCGYNW